MDSYVISYKNAQEEDVTCTITDRQSTTSSVYELLGTGLVLRNTNNDEDKFSPIRAIEAEFGFINSSQINLDTFASGEDNRFKVEIEVEGINLFIGYLVQDDIEEPFLHRGVNEVKLVAVDGLGQLKQVKLNETSYGEIGGCSNPNYKLIEYIAYALSPLQLDLDINVINNLYESNMDNRDDSTSACMFNQAYLDYRTFKSSFTEWDNCYTVIEKILGQNYFLTQYLGKWWVVRLDEYWRNYGFSYTTYNSTAVVQSGTLNDDMFTGDPFNTGATFIDDTGTPINQFINEDAVQSLIRPVKSVRLDFEYNQWDEVPTNNTFEHGDLLEDHTTWKKFEAQDLTQGLNFPTGGTNAGEVYIRRNYDGLGNESDRFLVIEPETGTNEGYVDFCFVPVNIHDKFDLSWDWCFSADAAGSGNHTRRIGICRIVGDDGTYWTLNEDGRWYQSNVTWTVNLKILQQDIELSDDQTQRINFSISPREIPATGKMYISFLSESISRYNVDVYISGFRLDYHAYINDGYQPVRSHYHKIHTTKKYLKEYEETVYISDTDRLILKGALMRFDGTNYVPTENWSNWDPNGTGYVNPPIIALGNYGKFQAFAVWNQLKRFQKKFRLNMFGIKNLNGDYFSLLFKVGVSTLPSGFRFFFTDMQRDLINCEVSGTMIMVYNGNDSYDQGDGNVVTDSYTGRWWTLVYNTGGGNTTMYYMDVSAATPSGYYKETTPGSPPYAGTVDLADYTFVGASLASLLSDLGITYPQLVSFTYSGTDSTITSSSTLYETLSEFKYVLE